MNSTPSLTSDQLLRHEAFVHGIARALLGDDAGARDVVQETWLTALGRSPKQESSTRAWLGRIARNLALDVHRSSKRRTAREQRVARSEVVESVDRSVERLSVQRDVVDVVLALREPYRAVILLRFFQGLDTDEVAARLDRSAATVRSQQSRALGILRESLDGKYGGDDAMWMTALLPAAGIERITQGFGLSSIGTPAIAGVIATAVGCVGLLIALRAQASTNEPTQIALAASVNTVGTPSPDPTPLSERAFALATTPDQEQRAAIAPLAQDADQADPSSLEGRTLEELRTLASQTQAALEAELLTPDPAVVAAQGNWIALADTGICRIVDREFADAELGGELATRGAGAYYSFATRSHSYNDSPDISFSHGRFSSGFYGQSVGLVAWIGDIPLDALPITSPAVPDEVPEAQRFAWDLLWRSISMEDTAHDSEFRKETEALGRGVKPTTGPMTYLVRACLLDEHDHLVAFRVLARDEHTITLGWRILKAWPAPGDRPRNSNAPERADPAPVVPEWLAALTLDQLLQRLADIRQQAEPLLFDVPEALREKYAELVDAQKPRAGSTSGFARILHRGEWDGLTSVREGGAYYSFSTGSNSFNDEPDLSLEQNRFSVEQDLRLDSLIDLGEIPFEELGSVMAGNPPPGLDERTRNAWDFLHTVTTDPAKTDQWGRRSVSDADAARAKELGFDSRGEKAVVGHVYLLRTVLSGHADQLVVFVVMGEDVAGYSIAWRTLRTWPIPPAPQRR